MVKAVDTKVIIETDKDEFVEKDGILLPTKALMREYMKKHDRRIIDQNYDNHIRHGCVRSVGNKARRDAEGVKEGDFVFFNRHDGVEFDLDGTHYIGIDWNLILCIYRK
jgi:co-chaperonin GroES (HSP10)